MSKTKDDSVFTKTIELPDWAKFNKADGFVEVEADIVYPRFLEQMKVKIEDVTQVILENCRKFFTRRLREITGPGLKLRIIPGENNRWKLSNFPA